VRRFNTSKEENHQIDISPLIDMVFILLIFFMVSTTFVKDMQIDIDRPGAASATPSKSKSIRVFIDGNENIFVDGQQVRSWVLQGKLRDLKAKDESPSVLIVTDKGVSADKLVEVVDQCRLSGIKDVGVATEREVGT
tara:strand:- start:1078 stop:1488 length:411 start_codon:yes stop_codon:yes gene_type:complete